MSLTDIEKLVEILKKKKEKGAKEYHFRPYSIDGVFCYIVLYFKYATLTVESVNIKCKYTYQGRNYKQPYVLYSCKYKSFKHALEVIQKITTKYKILNGDLESPENYEELKLEECVLPYSESECCSVCFENTTDTTICDHYICFNCREKCILQNQPNCPICRNENILSYYNNNIRLFNNRDSKDLSRIFIEDPYNYSINANSEDDDSESSSSDDESSSSEEENRERDINHIDFVNEENPQPLPLIPIVNEEGEGEGEGEQELFGFVIDRNPGPLPFSFIPSIVNEENQNHGPFSSIPIVNEQNLVAMNDINIFDQIINDFNQI